MTEIKIRWIVFLIATTIFLSALPCISCIFSTETTGYHDLLAQGFLKLQLNIPVEPNPELLRLADPYDPAQNGPYRLHDASLYEGKYYLYWGPVPAIIAAIPLRLLGLPTNDAFLTFVFILIQQIFIIKIITLLWKQSKNRSLAMYAGVQLLGIFASLAPSILRRPAFYEAAIICASAFAMISIYFLLQWYIKQKTVNQEKLLLAAGVAMALAIGARVTYIAPAGILVAWLFINKKINWAATLKFVAPLVIMGIALLCYNKARFDSFTEFGITYQLAGCKISGLRVNSFLNLVIILPSYLFGIPVFSTDFPFLRASTQTFDLFRDFFPPPGSYWGFEPYIGLMWYMPVLLAGLLLLRFASCRSVFGNVLLALGFSILVLDSYLMPGYTLRYEADFLPFLYFGAMSGVLRARTCVFGNKVWYKVAIWFVLLVSLVNAATFSFSGYGNNGRFFGRLLGCPSQWSESRY